MNKMTGFVYRTPFGDKYIDFKNYKEYFQEL